MKKMRLVPNEFVVALACIALAVLLMMSGTKSKPSHSGTKSRPSQCAVIHMPRSGCPAGYTKERAPRFTEKDGSKEFACVSDDPAKQGCIDVLKGGEEMEMFLPMPIPPDEPEGKPRT